MRSLTKPYKITKDNPLDGTNSVTASGDDKKSNESVLPSGKLARARVLTEIPLLIPREKHQPE